MLVSKTSGATPRNVVIDVSMIARNLSLAPLMIASAGSRPESLRSLMNRIIMSESFTTTPKTPTSPYSDHSPQLRPRSMCPASAPIAPSGTAAMMMRGCVYEPKGIAIRLYMMRRARMSERPSTEIA